MGCFSLFRFWGRPLVALPKLNQLTTKAQFLSKRLRPTEWPTNSTLIPNKAQFSWVFGNLATPFWEPFSGVALNPGPWAAKKFFWTTRQTQRFQSIRTILEPHILGGPQPPSNGNTTASKSGPREGEKTGKEFFPLGNPPWGAHPNKGRLLFGGHLGQSSPTHPTLLRLSFPLTTVTVKTLPLPSQQHIFPLTLQLPPPSPHQNPPTHLCSPLPETPGARPLFKLLKPDVSHLPATKKSLTPRLWHLTTLINPHPLTPSLTTPHSPLTVTRSPHTPPHHGRTTYLLLLYHTPTQLLRRQTTPSVAQNFLFIESSCTPPLHHPSF